MKHKTKQTTLITERQFNAQSAARGARPEQDSPGGTDVIDNDETLMGVNYMPGDPADVLFNEEEIVSEEELASREQESIS